MIKNALRPAVFLDRDGTINLEKDYLYKTEDFEFVPGAAEAIHALKEAGYLVVVVTNQSGVARGYFTMADVLHLHEHIQSALNKFNTAIDAFYICPHHPERGLGDFLQNCDCRKGQPGMLLQAARDCNIDLSSSYMVGDKLADIEAGESAGCTPIMVLTGYGQTDAKKLTKQRALVCDDLTEAVAYILNEKD